MNEQEALARMIPPAGKRPAKPYRGGVIQIHVTRACDKACYNCTQGSHLAGRLHFMSPDHFEAALQSLEGYWGVVGVFGGNPALHPQFEGLCELLAKYFPREQRGLWCNHPHGKGAVMRETFDPGVSNLNVHMDAEAYVEFLRDWPECRPVGLTTDSRHSPPWVALRDVLWKECPRCRGRQENIPDEDGDGWVESPCSECDGRGEIYDEERAWDLISGCDINQRWSAMLGVFRGQLRAWFCEIAGAQSIVHQDDPDYPDTGLDPTVEWEVAVRPGERLETTLHRWWELPMSRFADQARKHCHDCGVPLRGYGELACATQGLEQVSMTHQGILRPKTRGRGVELVTTTAQLGTPLPRMTDYLQNSSR